MIDNIQYCANFTVNKTKLKFASLFIHMAGFSIHKQNVWPQLKSGVILYTQFINSYFTKPATHIAQTIEPTVD